MTCYAREHHVCGHACFVGRNPLMARQATAASVTGIGLGRGAATWPQTLLSPLYASGCPLCEEPAPSHTCTDCVYQFRGWHFDDCVADMDQDNSHRIYYQSNLALKVHKSTCIENVDKCSP